MGVMYGANPLPIFAGVATPGDASPYSFQVQVGSAGTTWILSQTYATVPGVSYSLSYNYMVTANPPSSITCLAQGSQIVETITVDSPKNTWLVNGGSFTAGSVSTTLSCYFTAGGVDTFSFDNVVIHC